MIDYIFFALFLLVPIMGIICTFINRNRKEYTEIDVFINNKDDWFI